MQLVDWNLYHSFSTYFTASIGLDEAAKALVDADVAVLAFRPDGRIWFKKDRQVLTKTHEIERKPYFAQGTLKFDSELDYCQRECL